MRKARLKSGRTHGGKTDHKKISGVFIHGMSILETEVLRLSRRPWREDLSARSLIGAPGVRSSKARSLIGAPWRKVLSARSLIGAPGVRSS